MGTARKPRLTHERIRGNKKHLFFISQTSYIPGRRLKMRGCTAPPAEWQSDCIAGRAILACHSVKISARNPAPYSTHWFSRHARSLDPKVHLFVERPGLGRRIYATGQIESRNTEGAAPSIR